MSGRRPSVVVVLLSLLLAVFSVTACDTGKKGGDAAEGSGKKSTTKKKGAAPVCLAKPPGKDESGFAANHLVGLKDLLWENGMTLNVHFKDGAKEQMEQVKKIAPTWSEFANIKFAFFEDPANPPNPTHIRITFQGECGFNSALGTMSLQRIRKDGYSMQLACLDQEAPERQGRVIKHEFGHALGCFHEHQRAGLKYNKENVYKWCAESQGWDKAQCDSNILIQIENEIPAHELAGTPYDPKSIMHYRIRPEWTTDNVGIEEGLDLSDLDKRGIAEMYPKTGEPTAPAQGGGLIQVRNTAEPAQGGAKWTLFVSGPDDKLSQIKSVLYILHPSLSPAEADGDVNQPGFPYSNATNQPFTVRAMITYKDGSAELLKHTLDFTAGGGTPQPSAPPPPQGTGVAECDQMYALIEKCVGSKLDPAQRRQLEEERERVKGIATNNPASRPQLQAECGKMVGELNNRGCK
jgi:pYEATS domain-containing protein involved in immunity/astacin (peptidase family M12A)